MDFANYLLIFEHIINNPEPPAPYNNPDYLSYARLNWQRQQRWLKTGVLTDGVRGAMARITRPQHWTIITEPWCGDAAHNIPFIEMIAALNPLVTTSYQLRDQPPFLIEQYLTNGTKSIPKLIARDENGSDLFVWGPRPTGAQAVYDRLKAENADFEQTKTEIQKWYNEDKGQSFQRELLTVLEYA
ncbi:thioredoxin family protein [Chitinophaga lutea]